MKETDAQKQHQTDQLVHMIHSSSSEERLLAESASFIIERYLLFELIDLSSLIPAPHCFVLDTVKVCVCLFESRFAYGRYFQEEKSTVSKEAYSAQRKTES